MLPLDSRLSPVSRLPLVSSSLGGRIRLSPLDIFFLVAQVVPLPSASFCKCFKSLFAALALLHFVLAPLCENRSNKHGRLLISFSVLQCDFSHSGTREQNEILHNKCISTETCKTMQCKPQLHGPLFNPLETSAHSP